LKIGASKYTIGDSWTENQSNDELKYLCFLKSRESELLLNQIKTYKKWLGEHLLDFL
jgi:hypothetical protein